MYTALVLLYRPPVITTYFVLYQHLREGIGIIIILRLTSARTHTLNPYSSKPHTCTGSTTVYRTGKVVGCSLKPLEALSKEVVQSTRDFPNGATWHVGPAAEEQATLCNTREEWQSVALYA